MHPAARRVTVVKRSDAAELAVTMHATMVHQY